VAGRASRAALARLDRRDSGLPAARAVRHSLAQPSAGLELGAGRHSDLLQQLRRELGKPERHGTGRLQHEVDGAELERLQRFGGAFAGARRDHDDRTWPFDHDPIETLEPAHLRHLDVERDDRRAERLQPVERLDPVARELDLEVRLAAENLAEQLPYQRRVVDDQNLDHIQPAVF
jgi:hypothetical protein